MVRVLYNLRTWSQVQDITGLKQLILQFWTLQAEHQVFPTVKSVIFLGRTSPTQWFLSINIRVFWPKLKTWGSVEIIWHALGWSFSLHLPITLLPSSDIERIRGNTWENHHLTLQYHNLMTSKSASFFFPLFFLVWTIWPHIRPIRGRRKLHMDLRKVPGWGGGLRNNLLQWYKIC